MHIVQHLLIRYIKEKLKVSFYLYMFGMGCPKIYFYVLPKSLGHPVVRSK